MSRTCLPPCPAAMNGCFPVPQAHQGGLQSPALPTAKPAPLPGLRRSFATLCEWLDIPGGISAQIQGHAPQGVREQKYIRRPLDLLRVHHEKIEAWILEQAGIVLDAMAEPGKLRTVS